jgi:FkbM family methyltransferase
MPFISYAQNFEDVILWRALKQIEQGFYVDAGAQDPDVESVTRAFYERGWSGINIEPVDEYYNRLVDVRSRDVNLKIAAGREPELRTLYCFPGSGLSTLDAEISARHQAEGLTAKEIVVPVFTLNKVIEDSGAPTIHFLKIDVEGAESEVLGGLDLKRFRPWIIVVEANEPNFTKAAQGEWESNITKRGYGFAYFDGLNRFYVADEVSELKSRLAVPPNFFDDFVRASEWAYREKAANLEQELVGVRLQARENVEKVANLEQELASVRLQAQENTEKLRTEVERMRTEVERMHARITEEQAHRNHLLGRLRQLETQLSVPSFDRFLGRQLSRVRDRFIRNNSKH